MTPCTLALIRAAASGLPAEHQAEVARLGSETRARAGGDQMVHGDVPHDGVSAPEGVGGEYVRSPGAKGRMVGLGTHEVDPLSEAVAGL